MARTRHYTGYDVNPARARLEGLLVIFGSAGRLLPRSSGRWPAALAAGAGLALALSGALAPVPRHARGLPPEVAVRVNGHDISREELATSIARLYPSDPLGASREQRAEALRFLVEEELLVQRAVALRLAQTDRAIRSAIVMGMIDGVVEDVVADDPSEAELRDYYASRRAVFTRSPRWHVRHMHFPRGETAATAAAQAAEARAAVVAGAAFADVRARFGAAGGDLPDAPVPIHVLRRHLGPALTERVSDMRDGALSTPITNSSGVHLVQVVGVQPREVRPFEAVADVVRREYVRRARDTALDALLTALRAEADITVRTAHEAE